MIVYIEYAILDNMVINSILLHLACKSIGVHPKWWLIAISAGIGTVGAILLPLVSLPNFILIVLKLILGLSMILLVTRKNSRALRFSGTILFFVYTFTLGGIAVGILNLMEANVTSAFMLNYSSFIPVGVVILAAFFLMKTVEYLVKYVKQRKKLAPVLQEFEVEISGIKAGGIGFIDTGNRLIDYSSGLPIMIITSDWMRKNFKSAKFRDVRKLEVGSVGGIRANITVFTPNEVRVEGKLVQVVIGVTSKSFSDAVHYDAVCPLL